MSVVNCYNLFAKLKVAIDTANLKIIDNMTNSQMSYENICLKSDVTHDYFFSELKKSWEQIINDFISQADKCPQLGESLQNFTTKLYSKYKFPDSDSAIDFLLSETDSFVLSPDINNSLINFIKIYKENCKCQKSDIFAFLSKKYFQKYYPIYANDPEIKAYVINKITLVVDNLKKHTDQIELTDADGNVELKKLKEELILAKNKITSGADTSQFHPIIKNIEIILIRLQEAIKKNPIDNNKYGNLIGKMISRIRLIPAELKMQSIEVKTTNILAEFNDKISTNISKIDSKNPAIGTIVKDLKMNTKSIEDILSQSKDEGLVVSSNNLQNNFNLLNDNLTKLKSFIAQKSYVDFIDVLQSDLKLIQMRISKQTGGNNANVKIELQDTINQSMELLKGYFDIATLGLTKDYYGKIVDDIANKLVTIYSFSVGGELDKLIPNELGSLKSFFVKVISTYYDNLHPIIWVQIFRQMIDNFLIDLPRTSEEIFQFVSKYTLLNSGPFILKTLQMIRPVISVETASKYSLTKLSYPLMDSNQVDLILNKVISDWSMYKIMGNFSASVGHVCLVSKVDNPENLFIIKIIKPISIAQSCWEYKKLYSVYPEGSCERSFVQSIIKSNGKELNVLNEINNINKGFENYTGTYDVFTSEIDAKITTIQNIPDIINEDCWFALTMTLAPGISVSSLVEDDLLKSDTKYRAKLHRCLDLLVYHFFLGIIKSGYYHGDLHGGNMFFSYEKSQLTLIDFGAMGQLDIFGATSDTNTLLDIVIMSIFYNYDGILDTMTDLLNGKCASSGEKINKETTEYTTFKQTLRKHRMTNIITHDMYAERSEKYAEDIFGSKRIDDENKKSSLGELPHPKHTPVVIDSVYSYLEVNQPEKEVVIENRDVLPDFTGVSEDGSHIGFSGILDLIIKFYAKSGINIAVKFTEFYEFQKAYALLLGVLRKTNYSPYRTTIMLRKSIARWQNIPELFNLSTTIHVMSTYYRENNNYTSLQK